MVFNVVFYSISLNYIATASAPIHAFLDIFYPFPKQTILDSSKLKEVTDDNFKVDENGRKLSKQVEKTVRKGEIAHYEQFLLFPQCFQKTCTADM